jgi:hypothetical protein
MPLLNLPCLPESQERLSNGYAAAYLLDLTMHNC